MRVVSPTPMRRPNIPFRRLQARSPPARPKVQPRMRRPINPRFDSRDWFLVVRRVASLRSVAWLVSHTRMSFLSLFDFDYRTETAHGR